MNQKEDIGLNTKLWPKLVDHFRKPKVNNVVPIPPVVALNADSSKIIGKEINNLTAKPPVD